MFSCLRGSLHPTGTSSRIHMILVSLFYRTWSVLQDAGPRWSFSTGGRELEGIIIGTVTLRHLRRWAPHGSPMTDLNLVQVPLARSRLHNGRGSHLVHALHWESSNCHGPGRSPVPNSVQPGLHSWFFLPTSLCRRHGFLLFQRLGERKHIGNDAGWTFGWLGCVWNALHGSERHRQLYPVLRMETCPWVRHCLCCCQYCCSWGLLLL